MYFLFISIFFTSVTCTFYHSYHSWKDHIPSELTSKSDRKTNAQCFYSNASIQSVTISCILTIYWISYSRMVALEEHSMMMKFGMHFHTYSRYFIAIFSIYGTIWVPNAAFLRRFGVGKRVSVNVNSDI